MSPIRPYLLSSAMRKAGLLLAVGVLAGCTATGGTAGPTVPVVCGAPVASACGSSSTSANPSGSSADGFYLRAWKSQALPPQYTFTWLPVATVSDGKLIDGIVAVPAIYPGPLWVGPSVRTVSAEGTDAIVAEARKLGLLGTKSSFGEILPGGISIHIQMVIDGKTYDLEGDPNARTTAQTPAPGSVAAFLEFWQEISVLAAWIPGELGQSAPYEPDSLAVLALPPTDQTNGITPTEVPWPLTTPFSKFGTPLGGTANRCAVVTGADLATLEPVVKQSNQLTRFVDSEKVKDSLEVRVLVPGEPNPCG